ncbi:hypothetical protein Poli38472_011462 [Pythium oligandrum]|uniref:Probable pectate lyase F n=1 Tax=Pythium oligandrum TaxID=41045 RepID=A0A8K1CJG3_PYTOL|nr:hypothetical protein Poli38472_011462 [Pythium oligandrum]|eukprot:TMW64582.1 hypothetical protein Poli38472_011462 [Pythium oligandrum]
MVKFVSLLAVAALAAPALVTATKLPGPGWPDYAKKIVNAEPIRVRSGEVFNGARNKYERANVTCDGVGSLNESDAVFIVESNATLRNVVIGTEQKLGVICPTSDCKLEEVWITNACGTGILAAGGSPTSLVNITSGGARGGNQIVYHTGAGRVLVDAFFAKGVDKIYRPAYSVNDKTQRKVDFVNVRAENPTSAVAFLNRETKDVATFTNVHVTDTTKRDEVVCVETEASLPVGHGPSDLCKYKSTDIVFE